MSGTMSSKDHLPEGAIKRVAIEWHLAGDTAVIDWFAVPKHLRRKGVGRKAYLAWEARLPDSVTLVRLYAADSDGTGRSDGFWDRLGFAWQTVPGADTEVSQTEEFWWYMQKGVNGNETPPPSVYDSPCDDEAP